MSPQCGNSYSEHEGSKRAWKLNTGRTLARGLLAGMALVSWSGGKANRWVFPSGVTSCSFGNYGLWWTLSYPAFSALFDEHAGELLCGLIPMAEWSPFVSSSCPSANSGLHLTVFPSRCRLGSFKLLAAPEWWHSDSNQLLSQPSVCEMSYHCYPHQQYQLKSVFKGHSFQWYMKFVSFLSFSLHS